jgi:cell division protein ZapA
LLADELTDARARLSVMQTEHARLQSEYARLETRSTLALENAARKLEKLAAE